MENDRGKVIRLPYAKYGIRPERRAVRWVSTSYEDLVRFPKDAQAKLGEALAVAQEGGLHISARPMHGNLREVIEIVARCADGTYRLMYATQISEVIHVLHTFKKKAHYGAETPRKELRLVEARHKQAKEEARRS